MYFKYRKAPFHLITTLFVIITLANINVHALPNPVVSLHHNYENETDLDSLGYMWVSEHPENTIGVHITKDVSYTGENSLVIESYTFVSETYLTIPLNLEFNQLDSSNNFFSLHFYSYGPRISVVRVIFLDSAGRELSLDFGYSSTAWEPGPIFDISSEFPENEWYSLSRDLKSDIELAINFDGSYYPEGFTPIEILELFIFQPLDDGLYVNFIDDLIFADSPILEIEFNGNSDLTKYRNIGKIDLVTSGTVDTVKKTSQGVIEPSVTDIDFPISGLKLGIFFGISVIVIILTILFSRYKK